jgi:hypothetical protein
VTLPAVWLPEAEAGLRAAKSWYDGLRSALGGQFVSAVGAAVESERPDHAIRFPRLEKFAKNWMFRPGATDNDHDNFSD